MFTSGLLTKKRNRVTAHCNTALNQIQKMSRDMNSNSWRFNIIRIAHFAQPHVGRTSLVSSLASYLAAVACVISLKTAVHNRIAFIIWVVLGSRDLIFLEVMKLNLTRSIHSMLLLSICAYRCSHEQNPDQPKGLTSSMFA
jgi:hypothetical protein